MGERPGKERQQVLLVVALKTDQPNIERRLKAVLALAEPVDQDTEPQVFGKPIEELTALEYASLATLFTDAGVERLRLGAVTSTEVKEAPR